MQNSFSDVAGLVIWGGKDNKKYIPTEIMSGDKFILYKPQEKSGHITCAIKRQNKNLFFKMANDKNQIQINFLVASSETTRDIVFTVIDAFDKNNRVKMYNCPADKYFPDGVNIEIIISM